MSKETFGVGGVSGEWSPWKQARDAVLQITVGPFLVAGIAGYEVGRLGVGKIRSAANKLLSLGR